MSEGLIPTPPLPTPSIACRWRVWLRRRYFRRRVETHRPVVIGIAVFGLFIALPFSIVPDVGDLLPVLILFAVFQAIAQGLLFYVLRRLEGSRVLICLSRIGHRDRLDGYYWETVIAVAAFLMLAIPASVSPVMADPEAQLLPAALLGLIAWSTSSILRNLSINEKMLKFEISRSRVASHR